ncbi:MULTISPECIES: GNAT family N-acetyltransferase [Staphylococcus]|uniref:GNAT family N-acetyltransferase n=1 Tax=Staphylococcus hsinchuensis TaxID=3051183 RepID=A0ABZ3EFH9_9STAP|nr:GNAT family N-acetyltransferase [Staphylococcus sp. Marseille-Q5304]
MIKCVCLIVEQNDQLLLVQARNRQKYYFPGGKIDKGESYIQALQREVKEELQLDLPKTSFHYIGTVVGPAYPQKDTLTELNCFKTTETIDWSKVEPAEEITDLKWVNKADEQLIAPAVLEWIAHRKLNEKEQEDQSVSFKFYEQDDWETVKNIAITDEDRNFTKTPIDNIKLAQEDPSRYPTLVFNSEDQCIGFFTLHTDGGVAPYTENPNAVFFRSFSIDNRYRGKGYGNIAMQCLSQFISDQMPKIDEIYLTVNDNNIGAQKLYERCYYQYVGEDELEGRPVYVMKQPIK